MKNIILTAFLIFLFVSGINVHALYCEDSFTVDGIHYEVYNGEAWAVRAPFDITSATIPSTANGYPVTTLSGTFESCVRLKSVTLPNSITTIGEDTFYCCYDLLDITIPNSVTSIGYSAFSYCKSLAEIIIPKGVTSIDGYTFSFCENLTSISIPNTVTSIGNSAFSFCKSLTEINIPASLTSIGNSAFHYCTSLEKISVNPFNTQYCSENGILFNKSMTELIKVPAKSGLTSYTIPGSVKSIASDTFSNCDTLISIIIFDGVTSIGSSAFSDCTNLTEITIPDSVTSIGSSAFLRCHSLTEINIPMAVTYIGNNAFLHCQNLASITVHPDNSFYCSVDNVLFNKAKTELILCAIKSDMYSYTVPDAVITIKNYAFYSCESLMHIMLPDRLTTIEECAFYKCVNLTGIIIPESVTSIGTGIFNNCKNLIDITVHMDNPNYCSVDGILFNKSMTELIKYPARKTDTQYTLPPEVTTIGDSAFSYCENLTNIVLPDGLVIIGNDAFYSCGNLLGIIIPKKVTSIESDAFGSCDNMQYINVHPDNSDYCSIDGILFNKSVTQLIINPAKNTVSDYTVPDTVMTIETDAFRDCDYLTSLTIPAATSEINDLAIYLCDNLQNITVHPDNPNFASVDGVLFNKSMTRLILYPSKKASSEYVIPDTVITIETDAFRDCNYLTSLTIPAATLKLYDTSDEYTAICYCDNLQNITVHPDNPSYTSVDGVLFNKPMTKLIAYPAKKASSEYVIPDTVTKIGYGAFSINKYITKLTIPLSLVYVDSFAFKKCTTLSEVVYSGTSSDWRCIEICNDNDCLLNAYLSMLPDYKLLGSECYYHNSFPLAIAHLDFEYVDADLKIYFALYDENDQLVETRETIVPRGRCKTEPAIAIDKTKRNYKYKIFFGSMDNPSHLCGTVSKMSIHKAALSVQKGETSAYSNCILINMDEPATVINNQMYIPLIAIGALPAKLLINQDEISINCNSQILTCTVGSCNVTIEGKTATLSSPVQNISGTIMVPVGDIATLFGYTVQYDSITGIMSVAKPETETYCYGYFDRSYEDVSGNIMFSIYTNGKYNYYTCDKRIYIADEWVPITEIDDLNAVIPSGVFVKFKVEDEIIKELNFDDTAITYSNITYNPEADCFIGVDADIYDLPVYYTYSDDFAQPILDENHIYTIDVYDYAVNITDFSSSDKNYTIEDIYITDGMLTDFIKYIGVDVTINKHYTAENIFCKAQLYDENSQLISEQSARINNYYCDIGFLNLPNDVSIYTIKIWLEDESGTVLSNIYTQAHRTAETPVYQGTVASSYYNRDFGEASLNICDADGNYKSYNCNSTISVNGTSLRISSITDPTTELLVGFDVKFTIEDGKISVIESLSSAGIYYDPLARKLVVSSSEAATLYIVAYDENKMMSLIKHNITAGTTGKSFDFPYYTSDYTSKAFVWDKKFTPLCSSLSY